MTTLWTMIIVVTNMQGGLSVIPGYTYENKAGCEKELFSPVVVSGISVVSGVCVPYDPNMGGME